MKRLTCIGLLALALAPIAGTPATAQQPRASETVAPAGDVSAILLSCTQQTRATSVAKLVALGVDRIPELFALFAAERFPVRIGDHGNSHRPLSRAQGAALLEALGRLPRTHTLAFFQALAAAEKPAATERQRARALDVLGVLGTSADLALMVKLGQPAPGERRQPKSVRTAFGSALERLMQRDPDTLGQVPGAFRQTHAGLYVPMVEAVGATTSPERLEVLCELLGQEPRLDKLLLSRVGRMAAAVPHPVAERPRSRVRRYLVQDDPQLLVEAVLALQALEDSESFPVLIGLVEHEDVNVRGKTLTALRTLSGRQIPPDADRWSDWYEHETTWWETEAQDEFRVIRSGAPSQVSRLVLELSKKRFFRHELSAPIASALERREVDLVVMTCAALGHLGSLRSVPPLAACLEHEQDDVRAAAWRALQRITGRKLGPDPAPWQQLTRVMQEQAQ